MLKLNKLQQNQSGMVSLLVVSILTITLSLIAIGFSKLADRELRQASDREQSSQAYYAAQSGLNDAIAYVASPGATTSWGCAAPIGSPYFTQDISGNSGTAKYSCIRIDMTPTVLKTTVSPGRPELLKVSASALTNLYIGWQNHDNTSKWLPGSNSLPAEDSLAANGATGVLRVAIYEVPNSVGPCNDNPCLAGHSRVYYLYPKAGSGVLNCPSAGLGGGCADYSTGGYASGPTGNNGSFVSGICNTSAPNPVPANSQARPYFCNSEVTSLHGATYNYYLYLTAQYAEVDVGVQGTNGATPVQFHGSQATVDVTGQSSDALQRIKAQVNIGSSFDLPNYAIQSMETLCKNFTIDIAKPIGGVWQYGSANTKENPDNACSAPAGGGSIVGGPNNGH